MKLTYLGQCGFLIEWAGTRLVTDPYLSDYVDQTVASPEAPWQRLYPPPTSLAALQPDAILISHAHEDHFDPWTLQAYANAGGRATVALPAPELHRMEGMAELKPLAARAEQPFQVGALQITPIPCAHTQFTMDEAGQFYALSYFIQCGSACLFFGGDMSLYDGLVPRLRQAGCQMLLLPCNGRDEARTSRGIIGNINAREAAWLTRQVGAEGFVPMHHDLYAINGCSQAEIEAAAQAEGVQLFPLAPMACLAV